MGSRLVGYLCVDDCFMWDFCGCVYVRDVCFSKVGLPSLYARHSFKPLRTSAPLRDTTLSQHIYCIIIESTSFSCDQIQPENHYYHFLRTPGLESGRVFLLSMMGDG
jgi:hypothetical protein